MILWNEIKWKEVIKTTAGFMAAAAVLWMVLSLWVFGEVITLVPHIYKFMPEELSDGMKECHLDQEQYLVSETEDSWIVIQLKKAPYRILDIEIEDMYGDAGTSQIFYSDSETFTRENQVSFTLNQGSNMIALPENVPAAYLRLDLTSQAGVKFRIGEIKISQYEIKAVERFFLLYLSAVVFLTLFLWFCWKKKISADKWFHDLVLSEKKSFWFVVVLVSGIFFAIYGKLLLEDALYAYRDIGSDTVNQYIPRFYAYAGFIRDQKIAFWNNADICGSSNLGFFTNCANPFLLIVTLMGSVFGEQTMVSWLLVMQYIQILSGTYFCFKLLSLYGISNRAKIAASIVFSFNGFHILWGQHYHFAIFGLMNIAVIYSMEHWLQKKSLKNYLFLVLLTALSGLISVYMTYMILLSAGFYVLFRVIRNEKKKLMAIGKIFAAAALGLGLSAVLFIPGAVDLLNNSTRLSSDMGILEKFFVYLTDCYSAVQMKDITTRLLSNNLLGAANNFNSYGNYYEVPQLFFSCFSISIFVQYFFILWKKRIAKREKILSYAACAFLLFLLYNKAGSLAYNGFIDAFGRYTFAIMPFFAIAFAVTIDDILLHRYYSYTGLAVSAVINVFLLYRAYADMPDAGQLSIRILIAINVTASLFFFFFVIQKKNTVFIQNLYFAVFLGIIAVDVFFDSYVTCCERSTLSADAYEQAQEKINEVKDILSALKADDQSYYRIEKTFTDFSICDNYMEGYDGISGYNSTLNKNFAVFRDDFMPGMYTSEKPYRPKYLPIKYQFDQLGLLGVKYILSDRSMPDFSTYLTLTDIQDGYYIYQNNFSASFPRFYSEAYSYEDFMELSYKEKTDVLKNYVVLKGRFENHTGSQAFDVTNEVIKKSSGKEKIFCSTELKDQEYLAASFSILSDEIFGDTMKVYTASGGVYDYMIHTGSQTEYYFLLPENVDRIEFINQEHAVYDISDFKIYKDRISEEKVEGSLIYAGSRLQGKTETAENGWLFLPMVYQDGWSLEVDGEPAELLHADAGFMAFYLTKGEHEYCIRYRIPGMREGAYISISSILAVIFMTVRRVRPASSCKKKLANQIILLQKDSA